MSLADGTLQKSFVAKHFEVRVPKDTPKLLMGKLSLFRKYAKNGIWKRSSVRLRLLRQRRRERQPRLSLTLMSTECLNAVGALPLRTSHPEPNDDII